MDIVIFNNPDYDGVVTQLMPVSITAAQALADHVPPAATGFIVDNSTLPTDNTFRNAWKADGLGAVAVDMPIARALWKLAWGYVLEENMLLAAFAGNYVTVAASIQSTIATADAAVDVAALKAVWPAGLPVKDYSVCGIGYKFEPAP